MSEKSDASAASDARELHASSGEQSLALRKQLLDEGGDALLVQDWVTPRRAGDVQWPVLVIHGGRYVASAQTIAEGRTRLAALQQSALARSPRASHPSRGAGIRGKRAL